MIEISGTTKIFAVIGWPVEQVKAPALFNAYFQQHDIDARVIPLKIEPDNYCSAVRTLMAIPNVGGIFVSIPHKPMTIDAVDVVSLRAGLAGACNAVYKDADGKIIGDLIDGEGFVRALDITCSERPFDYAHARALVVGIGGVGRAIATALLQRGIAEVSLYDARAESALAMQGQLAAAFPNAKITLGTPHAAGFDLVVNASPLGMNPDDPMPIALDGIKSSCVVADCGMKTEMTKLLQAGEALGCRIQKGKEMLIEQAPLYLDLFGWPGVKSDAFRELGAL